MTLLHIYSLDDPDEQNLVASLGTGIHVIGRGALLQVEDKRVSRKHAIIEVSDQKITLTSVHINPCFFKAANSRTLTVITQNQKNEISDGDQFALLPENCWYRVKIKAEIREEPQTATKRGHEIDNNHSSEAKKARMVEDEEHDRTRPSLQDETSSTLQNGQGEDPPGQNIPDVKIEQAAEMECQSSTNDALETTHPCTTLDIHNDITLDLTGEKSDIPGNPQSPLQLSQENISFEIKEELLEAQEANEASSKEVKLLTPEYVQVKIEPADDEAMPVPSDPVKKAPEANEVPVLPTLVQPSTSGTGTVSDQAGGPKRERCWYGDTCYRKNPSHRATLSHPGDNDYDSGADGDRPECPFGSACYRTNLDHRKLYKHVSKPAQKPKPQKLTPRAKRPQRNPSRDDEDSEDDYDYSDPFLNDDSGDDYEVSDYGSDSSESYFEDSQEIEESGGRRRRLREAKKFINRKN